MKCGWGAALLRDPWGCWWAQAEQESAVCRCSSQGTSDPGLHLQGCDWQRQRRDHSNPLSACLAAPGVLCSVLVLTIPERGRWTGEGPKEDHEGDQRAEKPAQQEKTEGVRSLLPGEKKAWRAHHHSVPVKVAPGEVSSLHKKEIFYSDNDHSQEQLPLC